MIKFDLNNRVAIVTGGAQGFGLAITERFIESGAKVVIWDIDEGEAKKALRFNEALIGINNRNLKTLKTEINTTYEINDFLKDHTGPLISESGIKTKDELLELSKKTSIKTFLIGESLLKNLENNSIFSVLS